MQFKYHILYYLAYKNKKIFLNKRIILIYLQKENPQSVGTKRVFRANKEKKKV
tara:strand:- start:383 stop:541 length:159 start_codon:yes stop_codon:yes gene_type:complete